MDTNRPLTVVCAEDDPDVVELVRISVEGEPDFELVGTTGEAAAVLDLVRRLHPDVVILDHMLDENPAIGARGRTPRGVARPQTGLELVAGARAAAPEATIVIFTGRCGLRAAAQNVGADAYVEKPAFSELWPTIREARA